VEGTSGKMGFKVAYLKLPEVYIKTYPFRGKYFYGKSKTTTTISLSMVAHTCNPSTQETEAGG
jgi:hypothetical protein